MKVNMIIPVVMFLSGNFVYEYFQTIPNWEDARNMVWMQWYAMLFVTLYPFLMSGIRK